MDFITGLPASNMKDTLWVIIDRMSKIGHFVACEGTMDPTELADCFVKHVV